MPDPHGLGLDEYERIERHPTPLTTASGTKFIFTGPDGAPVGTGSVLTMVGGKVAYDAQALDMESPVQEMIIDAFVPAKSERAFHRRMLAPAVAPIAERCLPSPRSFNV